MHPIETVEHKGYKISVHVDEDPMHPRRDWDGHLGLMLCFHKRYDLGDSQKYRPELPTVRHGDFGSWDEMREHLEKECGAIVILPLFLYDHSGISMSVGSFMDCWDSGQVGFIFTTREAILKEYSTGKPRKRLTANLLKQAEERLKHEVEEYDTYLRGEVYGYTITDPNGEDTGESCWGFFGDTKYMIEEAKGIVDAMAGEAALREFLVG